MNTMRILICATFAVLVAALTYTYINKDKGVSLAELEEKHYQALRARDAQNAVVELPTTSIATPTTTSSQDALINQYDAEQKRLAELEEAKLAAEEIKRQADEAEAKMLADTKTELDSSLEETANSGNADREKLIAAAHAMARVNHYDETGQIVIVDILRPQNIVPGQTLGIRRGNGVIGRVKLGSKVPDKPSQAFADPIPASFFGAPINIQAGDDLIYVP